MNDLQRKIKNMEADLEKAEDKVLELKAENTRLGTEKDELAREKTGHVRQIEQLEGG